MARFPYMLVALSLLGFPVGAAAQADYAPDSGAWNGLARFMALATTEGVTVETPERVDVSQLRPEDSLILVYPTGDLPLFSLAAFLRAGGRIVVADDFGSSAAFLDLYQIHRRTDTAPHRARLRGNPALPLAIPRRGASHPLTEGHPTLVTNHPAVLVHSELRPLFGVGEAPEAVVLAGAVEEGRLVAVSDPSLFINNMLQFRDNRVFAANLLHYLADDRPGRVLLATGATPIVGRFSPEGSSPVLRVRHWLTHLAQVDLPPMALQIGALLLVSLLVLMSITSLPHASPYDGSALLPRRSPAGGFLGRVRFFRDRPSHLMHPLMVYKHELEAELIAVLGLTGRPRIREIKAGLRKRGLPEEDIRELASLLVELAELHERQDRPPDPPRIPEGRFVKLVNKGERILQGLRTEQDRP